MDEMAKIAQIFKAVARDLFIIKFKHLGLLNFFFDLLRWCFHESPPKSPNPAWDEILRLTVGGC